MRCHGRQAATGSPTRRARRGRHRSRLPGRVARRPARCPQVAETVRRPIIAALARCHDRDIVAAAEALQQAQRKRIHVFIATSDLHLEQKLRIDRATCIERPRAVRQARGFTPDVEFSAEDATRSDLDFLARVVLVAITEGATTINSGYRRYTTPAE